MSSVKTRREETTKKSVKVYSSMKDLPEVLEPGRYIVEGEELEVLEPLSRDAVIEIIRFFRERRGHKFI